MSLPAAFSDPVLDSRDLVDDRVRDAYEQGHDADVSPTPAKKASGMSSILSMSIEKAGDHFSKSSSADQLGDLEDIEKGSERGDERKSAEAKEDHDPNMVFWDEPIDQDPSNPRNWSTKKKWGNIGVVSGITFVV
jgi:hypothetical protein